MKPFEFDSRNFPRRMTFRRWVHEHPVAGRIFAVVGLVLVIPTHAIAGAIQQIRGDGMDELNTLLRMAFATWKDRNPKSNQGGAAT